MRAFEKSLIRFNRGVLKMDIDFRVAVVLAPIAIAAGWAVFNIGAAAIKQVQNFLSREA
jgi:photosystem II PsbY protein